MQAQTQFFLSGKTRSISWRLHQLQLLKQSIKKHELIILEALCRDLGKPEFEAYSGEINPVLKELDYFLDNLCKLACTAKQSTSLLFWPSTSYVTPTPYGTVLIMAPWNFPFQLSIIPLIGALAGGNCAVIKPSELAPHTAAVIATIIQECFDASYVSTVQGGIEVASSLLDQPFDYIFFTGSAKIGKIVMHKAADQLIPVTLELGGKNPCIVDETCNINVAAKRIAWGKYFNAGQNCLSPDYVLIHASKKEQFIHKAKEAITQFYGTNPQESPDYARIINQTHIERLTRLLNTSNVIFGGTVDAATRYIAPTIVDNVHLASTIMQEEVFGPIMPIITYDTLDEALALIGKFPKPLAVYAFSKNSHTQHRILKETHSGAACINDVVIQAASTELPFGGVGASGIGRYHGKYSFATFSYERAVVESSNWFDVPLRYAPYTKLKRWLLKLVS